MTFLKMFIVGFGNCYRFLQVEDFLWIKCSKKHRFNYRIFATVQPNTINQSIVFYAW